MKTLIEIIETIGPSLASHIEEEEINRKPSPITLRTLKENGLLKLFLPKSLGGLETDPILTAKAVELVAHHNTTAAWSMMVSNGSAWFGSMLPEKGVEEIFNNNSDVQLAGAFHPLMKAKSVSDGYIINGRTPLASNVSSAKWIFVTASIMENEQLKINNGIPEIIGVYMKLDECQILDTWHTNGMRATDSNDVLAQNVFVPNYLQYPLMPGTKHNKYYTGALYNFPAIGASSACLLAPIALATATDVIHEFKMMAEKKVPFGSMVSIRDRGTVQRKLGLAEANVQSSRAYLFQKLTDCWDKTNAGEKLSMEERAGLLLAATHTNATCCKAVDLLYSAAGSSAVYTKNKINYHFANTQVMRQHGFVNESRYETAAQVYLGLPPDLPVLAF